MRKLENMLYECLKKAADQDHEGEIGIIISPHAGYVYSVFTAAFGFKAASSQKVNTVIILAPSNQYSFEGACVWSEGLLETLISSLEVDKELASRIMAFDKKFLLRRDVFEGSQGRPENSVETQLPLIKKIITIIVGNSPDANMVKIITSALNAVIGGRIDVLIDISADQSHFHSLQEAKDVDGRGLKAIEDMDIEGFWQGHVKRNMEVDGFHVDTAGILYALTRKFNRAKVLHYETSAVTTGNSYSVVGYAFIAFFRNTASVEEDEQSRSKLNSKVRLLSIARETLETFFRKGKSQKYNEDDPRLSLDEGAFVTLHKHWALRVCISNIIGRGPALSNGERDGDCAGI